MKTVCDVDACCGCMLCVEICPKQAVSIRDSLKAYNAIIDINKCIFCGLCSKLCQVNHPLSLKKSILWKQGWANDPSIRRSASSGGIASAISANFVRQGGIVCSCVFQNGEFVFKLAETEKEIKDFVGSKYVKSNPIGIYKKIQKYLNSGRDVLLIALPCQIAAAKQFVSNDNHLYTIDLICHGSSSPVFLNKYLKDNNIDINTINDLNFRKKNHFGLYNNNIVLKPSFAKDYYTITFLNSTIYTENCYHCVYATRKRVSDITIGDSWGSELSEEEKKLGVSLILCQTQKGKKLIELADLRLYDVDIEHAIQHNHQLKQPSNPNRMRHKFISMIQDGKKYNFAYKVCFPKKYIISNVKIILSKLHL